MLMFKIFDKNTKPQFVEVRAQAPDGPLSIEVPIDENCFLDTGNFLHQMAARRQIQDLEESGERQDDNIKAIAMTYGIASKFTSFVGVDKKTRKSLLEPAMMTRQIKQEFPYGFQQQGIFGGYGGHQPQIQYASPPLQFQACVQSRALGALAQSFNLTDQSSRMRGG